MAKKGIKAIAIIAAVGMLVSSIPVSLAAAGTESAETSQKASEADVAETAASAEAETGGETLYSDYKAARAEAARPKKDITVFSGEQVLSESVDKSIKAEINVGEEGMYALEITYQVFEVQSSSPAISVKLNGSLPFYEATNIGLSQRFKDAEIIEEGDVEIPESELLAEYQTRYLYDTFGYYGGLLEFYLEKGKNTVEITGASGELKISEVKFTKYNEPPAYSEVKDTLKGEKYDGEYVKVQAEVMSAKSDSTIYAINDRSSASVEPSTPYERWLNAMGGTNWENLGEYVEWKITVPEDALYTLSFKYRKETDAGLDSNRRIYIDGEIPYKELESYAFSYTGTFEVETLSTAEGEEMLFYLTKGEHTVKMEVAIGAYSSILPRIYAATQELQNCYRQYVMIMGTAPDSLRDYQLDTLIPDVLENMKQQRIVLEETLAEIEALTGGSSSGTQLMASLINQILYFEEDSYYISADLQSFKSNIASVITWVLDVKVQPLKLDFIAVCPPEEEPADSKGWWYSLKYNLANFFFTFAGDYEYAVLDSDDPKVLTVWDPSGATEFSIWRQLVQYDFAKDHPEITVNFKNVSTGFQQAFLAGLLPDVYVGLGVQSLMEYAFRDVIVTDLTSVAEAAGDDMDEVLKDYNKWTYYNVQYDGKLYGYPMSITVPALFYRTDIMNEMKLDVPQTWDDLIYVSTMMQKKNLEVGIPVGIGTWKNMIYQKGGRTVDDARTTTYLMNDIAIDTFTSYTSFYTEYSSPVSFSAFDRFRTGEMPVVLADLTFINQLDVLAPEINGKWDFTHYPATEREDGTLDYTVASGSATYMVITNRRPEMAEAAWEFIKWRGSADTLVSINSRMEMQVGRSVRAVSANREAQDRIAWSTKAQNLYDFYEDWRYSEPEVPGDYFVQRAYTNSWTAVYYQDAVPGDALKLYIPSANAEITRRREYFGMDE